MLQIEASSLTDTGMIREENEDCAWSQIYQPMNQEPVGLFIVCDGMGGHMGGKYASYWAVEAIKHEFADLFVSTDPRATLVLTEKDIQAVRAGKLISPKVAEQDLEDLTRRAIQKANHVVYDFARHKPKQAANAGTTVTMAVLRGKQLVIANVGDSRTYLVRDHELIQLTRDHSLVASMVAEGHILPTEIYTHPQRNVIYRFLGQRGLVQPDIFFGEVQVGEHLLLCSDGLWEMVRNEERTVQVIEKSPNLDLACQTLVKLANNAGGEDNISLVIVKIV
jgi:protein phosphatase